MTKLRRVAQQALKAWARRDPDIRQYMEALSTELAVPEPGWETPTTALERMTEAVELLCGGKRPADEMVQSWLDGSGDSLQKFAIEHGPAWAQGIGLLDAAAIMASQPTEGVEHEELRQISR